MLVERNFGQRYPTGRAQASGLCKPYFCLINLQQGRLDLDHSLCGCPPSQSRPMPLLHTLRNTPWLAKLALLWFALTLGVAVASPLVNPQNELLICTAVGMVKVVLNADGSVSTSASAEVHCPLCVGGGAPPVFVTLTFQSAQPQGHVRQRMPAAYIATLTAAPPPPRGPPSV
jgi:hypothetical protein